MKPCGLSLFLFQDILRTLAAAVWPGTVILQDPILFFIECLLLGLEFVAELVGYDTKNQKTWTISYSPHICP